MSSQNDRKTVLVIQNLANTGLGQIRAALDDARVAIDHRLVFEGDTLPVDASAHDAIIVLGGAQNALDDQGSPYFPALLELLRDFEGRDKAVMGVCLGSQLLARAFGATNHLGAAEEFGWQEVALTEAAQDDPVFGGLVGQFPIFQWHDDTFDLPASAIRLATNAVAENQAFRIGRAAYGFQFHFEANRFLVGEWNGQFSESIADRYPDWPGRFAQESDRHGAAADAAGDCIARAWVALI